MDNRHDEMTKAWAKFEAEMKSAMPRRVPRGCVLVTFIEICHRSGYPGYRFVAVPKGSKIVPLNCGDEPTESITVNEQMEIGFIDCNHAQHYYKLREGGWEHNGGKWKPLIVI